jgi:hypothetical protein
VPLSRNDSVGKGERIRLGCSSRRLADGPVASLLVRSQPAAGMLPRSRLATGQTQGNACIENSLSQY